MHRVEEPFAKSDAPASLNLVPKPVQDTLLWLIGLEDYKTARSLAGTICRHLPQNDAATEDLMAWIFFRSKSFELAAEHSVRALKLMPSSIGAKFNAAKCLHSAGDPVGAEKLIREVIEVWPENIDSKMDLANYVCTQGRHEEAYEMLMELSSQIDSNTSCHDTVTFNLGWHDIRHGDFLGGMAKLSVGRKLKIWGGGMGPSDKPMLTPETSVNGKTVLLVGEGGAGDEIVNVRFAKTIHDRGGSAIWLSRNPVSRLFWRVPGLARVASPEELPTLEFDCWAPAMDLPGILRTDLNEIPNAPYLSPSPPFEMKWERRVRDKGRFKVGIRWAGNALYENDLMRSVPFSFFESIFHIPGIDFYSLQRDDGIEERPADSPARDWGTKFESWEDTAGAIANLDLVISSCTSVPHLAAAMGRPVWLLCPLNSYYLWAGGGVTSPWYRSIRLFRQTRYGSWNEPFATVTEKLKDLSSYRPSSEPLALTLV